MALFPVNQNVQWFTPTADEITSLKSTGVKKEAGKVWFAARSGQKTHASDVIEIKNGGYIKYVAATHLDFVPQGVTITYDTNVSATPISGEIYGIYVNQRNYHAIGDRSAMEFGGEVRYGSKFIYEPEGDFSTGTNYVAGDVVKYTDNKTYVFNATHSAGSWTTDVDEVPEDGLVVNSTALLMSALAQSFARNLGSDSDLYTVTHNATSVTILPKAQSWIEGTMQNEHFSMDKKSVFLSNIIVNTIERNDWASIASANGTTQKNSKDVADMEWFYLGEHGDQMRLMGYPNVNPAQIGNTGYYNVEPTSTYGYDLIYIHHAYIGSNHAVQKSEKDIIIAIEGASSSMYDDANYKGEFSTSVSYLTGDIVLYNHTFYKFTSNHSAGAWNNSHATTTNVVDAGNAVASNIARALGAVSGDVISKEVYTF